MKRDEDCLYCLCNDCYMRESKKNETLSNKKNSRRSIRCQKSNNIREGMSSKKIQMFTTAKTHVICDHITLNCYIDFTYFTKEYIKKRQDLGHKLPTKCTKCGRFIVNKI